METRFRSALHEAIFDGLVAPITTRVNPLAKTAIFHPDISSTESSASSCSTCVDAVRKDIEGLSGEK